MVLSYAYCNVAVLPVRQEPTHRAEQTSQLLFGEKAMVLEVAAGDWARIRVDWDAYEGWCKLSQLQLIDERAYRRPTRQLAARHNGRIVFEHSEMWLPLGAELRSVRHHRLAVGLSEGHYKGKKLAVKDAAPIKEQLQQHAMQYLHAPYQWGGRTVAGIDCSGFTQMVFKLCGRRLLRDASQQATEGQLVDFLPHAVCGDLAFFDNAEGKIVHVGLLLDADTIIHATETTGRVVIDKIDQSGIISTALRRRTHQLRLVRHYFDGYNRIL